MGITTKTVKLYPRGASIAYYKEKGYDAKYGQELEVKVEDLQLCSTVLVDTTCDYCGKQKPPQKYVNYNAQTKNGTEKCCCIDCAPLKQHEVMMKKYGYEYAFQIPELKRKIQETNIERYGSISPASNKAVKEKAKQTNLEKYGVENSSQLKEVQEKVKRTNLEKYGVENVSQNEVIKNKIKQTNLERYGVENVSQNLDIKNKRIQTFIERFGVENPLQNNECFEKMKKTNMDRYGTEFAIQSEDVRKKVMQTSLERYGENNPLKSKEVQEKVKKTNLERYGVTSILSLPSFHEHSREIDMERYGVYHHLQNPEILAKQKETFYKKGTCPTSKQQIYLHNLYGGELNYSLSIYNLDIYLTDENIDIEFDGFGHRLGVAIGSITESEFERKEIMRNTTIKNTGTKCMRIVSKSDKLPSDKILLQMLSESRDYFATTSHTWQTYNIDKSLLFNAENKQGIPYDFGSLRTIKDSDINFIKNEDLNTTNNNEIYKK